MDHIQEKLAVFAERKRQLVDAGLYFYLRTVDQLDGAHVWTGGKRMLMLASYSYLGLIGHPKINAAARQALEKYGTGTHGVRILAGTLPVHVELEEEIARFKGCLLYTSDAADDLLCVDLGGRRIIKKKKT